MCDKLPRPASDGSEVHRIDLCYVRPSREDPCRVPTRLRIDPGCVRYGPTQRMDRRHFAKATLLATLLTGATAVWAGAPRTAHGEPSVRVALRGSSRCAARPGFEAEVQRLVGTRPASGAPEQIDVRLSDTRGGVKVELRVARDGSHSHRALVLESCAAANDAAVLLAALSIDPTVKLPEPPLEAPPAPSTEGTEAGPPGPPASDPPSGTPAPAAEVLPASSGVATSEGEPAEAGAAEAGAPEAAASLAPPPDSRPSLWGSSRRFVTFPTLVRVAGMLDPKQLDGPSGSLAAELGIGLAALEAALGARASLPHTLDGLPAGADVSLSAFHATGRGGFRIVRGAFALIPCATLSLGMLRVGADAVRTPTVERAFIADVGVGAQGEWAFSRHFAVDLGAELVLPLRRPELVLDGARVFQLPAVAGRLALGLRFWTLLPQPQP
jgi:hypothetical protein